MAITPQHQKGEPTEADLEHAYNRAKSIGLFLVEKYARTLLREQEWLEEFIMENGEFYFLTTEGEVANANQLSNLARLIDKWDVLRLADGTMRFTATGPIRREW